MNESGYKKDDYPKLISPYIIKQKIKGLLDQLDTHKSPLNVRKIFHIAFKINLLEKHFRNTSWDERWYDDN